MIKKLYHPLFAQDIGLLITASTDWDFEETADFVVHELGVHSVYLENHGSDSLTRQKPWSDKRRNS